MDKVTLGLIALRAAALAAMLAGQTKLATQIYQIADFLAAGLMTDQHMKLVADKLAERNAIDADFTEVLASIDAERAKLHDNDGLQG